MPPTSPLLSWWQAALASLPPATPALLRPACSSSPSSTTTLLTLEEVDHASDALAAFLSSTLGVVPGDRVGLLFKPSQAAEVVALVALLKCGALCVPLRRSFQDEIVADAGLRLVLAPREWNEALPASLSVLYLGARGQAENDTPPQQTPLPPSPPPPCSLDGAFNILYTSGSTGPPKGVVGREAGFVYRLRWMHAAFPFSAAGDEVVLRRTPLSFVDSVWEIWGALLAGIPLLLHTDNASGQDPAFLPCPGVTRITLTPSLLSTLLQSPAPLFTPGSSLRLCLCSGEALSRDLAAGFFAALPLSSSTTLLHLYGSTEVSGDATFLALTREEMQTKAKEVGLVPLGRPLPGTRLWVVEDGNAVEVEGERQEAILDMEGELWVEGPGVALGYYRASESSDGDNVFFHREEGSPHLTFKTGDWVRYTHGAEAGQPHVLTFRIRRDSMVKVRGIRVGLEEGEGRIAAALQVENPRGALGLTLAPRPSDSSSSSSSHSVEDNVLVLAVTAQVARRWPDQARLRAQLQAAGLPEEMMPFRIVVGAQGQALPLTTSGKLDRQQLATWGTTAAHSSTHTHTPPMRRQEEESEVDAWLEARFAALVGSHDLGAVGLGLFERGGHSLLAMQALSELRARFGAVAERLTVEDLGRKVSEIARLLLPEGQRKRPRAEEQDVVGAFAVTMSERWRFALDKCVDAQPCLVPMGEAAASWWVILGAHDHTVVALDLQTGQQQWRARVQGRVEGAVSVHKDLAFVPCYDGRVYALRLRTGEEVWSCLTEGEIKCTPLPLSSPTEVVVIGSYDGHLYICETSGGTLWAPRTALGGSLFAAPLLLPPPSGGEKEARIITVTNKGRVAQWRLQEGGGENDLPGVLEQEWCYEVGCPVFTTPALSPSTSWLLLGGTDGSVFALDPTQGGAVVWRISLQGGGGGPVFASPCLLMSKDGEETVLVASQHKGSLHCLGAHSGKSKWWVEMAAAGSDNEVISGKPALLGDRFALVGTSHGRVQVVDVLDGRVVAAPLSLGQAQQRLSSPAAMQVGESTWRVVCGSRDDGVYMIEVQAGMK